MTPEQLSEAELKFPMPRVTANYLNHFPKGQFIIIEILLFVAGFVMTAVSVNKLFIGLVTLLFVLILLCAAIWHTIAWIAMRRCEVKRAKYLGISLQEYWEISAVV
jgi:hypothetical protein